MVDFGYQVFNAVQRPTEPMLEYVVIILFGVFVVVMAALWMRSRKKGGAVPDAGGTGNGNV